MALGDTYISLAELKTRLGVTDTNDDTLFTGAITAASRGIDGVCNRQFNDAGAASARVYYPDSRCQVTVEDFHTTTGLVVATDTGDDGTYETTWDATDYQLEPLNGIINGENVPWNRIVAVESRYFSTSSRRAPVQVTARWGWESVPGSIKEATYILAEDIAKLRDLPFGAGGFSEFGRMRARKNPHVMMLVDQYIDSKILVS